MRRQQAARALPLMEQQGEGKERGGCMRLCRLCSPFPHALDVVHVVARGELDVLDHGIKDATGDPVAVAVEDSAVPACTGGAAGRRGGGVVRAAFEGYCP